MHSGLRLSKVVNSNTQVPILSGAPSLEVVEFGDSSLVFQAPAKATPGQFVQLDGELQMGKTKKPFRATGRIRTALPASGGLNRFTVDLHQFDRGQWKRFVEHARDKQTHADNLFDAIRGE